MLTTIYNKVVAIIVTMITGTTPASLEDYHRVENYAKYFLGMMGSGVKIVIGVIVLLLLCRMVYIKYKRNNNKYYRRLESK